MIELLGGNDQREMGKGDIFVMKTPGGGGFGSVNKKRVKRSGL